MNAKKKTTQEERNWGLVFICSVLIVIGIAMMFVAIGYMGAFGWWSLLIGVTGLTTVFTSVMSIVKNDPTWVLLGLIIPG